ncbi:hypothetical protein C1H46_026877 [Malus baccata]|uniref:Uncharacterized protein n=1 Tax=Malus baccata TaxID=106549 RepID=A0A540LMD8_MALBA|nr:hypothetical protein C1H46_026877 [Malus baccata]
MAKNAGEVLAVEDGDEEDDGEEEEEIRNLIRIWTQSDPYKPWSSYNLGIVQSQYSNSQAESHFNFVDMEKHMKNLENSSGITP